MKNVVFTRSDFALMHDLINHALEVFEANGQSHVVVSKTREVVDKIEAIIAMGDHIDGGEAPHDMMVGRRCANCGHEPEEEP